MRLIGFSFFSPYTCTVGLLTVEAKQRLTLKELVSHPWLNPEAVPTTPLQTNCVLGQSKTMASAIKQTFHAFYEATRTGFTLGDVSKAPLAKRRKNKRGLSPRVDAGKVDGGEDEKRVQGEDREGESLSSSASTDSQSTGVSDGLTHKRPSKLNLLSPFSYEEAF